VRTPRSSAALLLLLVLPLVLSAACSKAEARIDLQDPADLGAFAARIDREPERADALLEEAGVTREELHEAILRVATDPEAARAYRDAFEAGWKGAEDDEPPPPAGG
jgi:DNA-binding GntR family transcriptional regulator